MSFVSAKEGINVVETLTLVEDLHGQAGAEVATSVIGHEEQEG